MALPQQVTSGRLSEDEFVNWCDEDTRAEFIDGEVVQMSPESGASEDARWTIGSVLLEIVTLQDLGIVRGPNFQIRLRAGLRRIPDVIFISKDRLQFLRPKHLEGAPDLAVEIVSEDSIDRDRREKLREYEEAGIPEYWIIDPEQQRVDLYRLNAAGGYEPVVPQDGAFHSTVIPVFWLRPEWIWERPRPGVIQLLRRMGVLPGGAVAS